MSLMYRSQRGGMPKPMAHRFGESHDPANFVYHYPGCAPVEVGSHDPTEEVFVVQLAERVWDIKFKVDAATFKPVIAAMVANGNALGEHDQEAMNMAHRHGDAIIRACSEFCELNLLVSPPTAGTH